jgi:hypothetical protein
VALNARQQRFVQEYLLDLNAAAAARRAGYSARTARFQGGRLLANVDVSGAVAAAQAARSERTALDQDYVLRRLKAEAEREGKGASHSARVTALRLLGLHVGMWPREREPLEVLLDRLPGELGQAIRRELAGLLAAAGAGAGGGPGPPLPLAEWAGRYLRAEAAAGPVPLVPESALHFFLAEELDRLRTARGRRLGVLAPRGSAKSTWSTLAYPLWCALEGLENYIVLTADTGQQAHKYLDTIRRELETNDRLAAVYPRLAGPGPVWREDRIRLQNGVVIEALGTGTKLRGRKNRSSRPSLIIVDDPQNTEHITSALQRQRTWEWLVKDVCNAGGPQTNIVVLGTALHRECIVCRLQETPGWRTAVFRSVVRWPERMDLWREWEGLLHDWEDPDREANARAFYDAHPEMDDGQGGGPAEVLWPGRESLYDLMLLRAAVGGAAFNSEKQNDPNDPALCEWPADYFDWPGLWFDRWPERERLTCTVLALDPSKGQDAKLGDFSAYVRLGLTADMVMYVEADLRRDRQAEVIVADGVEHCSDFAPDGFVVETNTFAELFVALFREAGRREGVPLPILNKVNTRPKVVRIRRLGSYLHQRRFRFKARSPGTAELVRQLRDFPNGAYDDGPDALELGLDTLIDLHNRAARRRDEPTRWRV